MKKLLMEDIGELYQKHTGGKFRTKSFDTVLNWADRRTDLFTIDGEGFYYLKKAPTDGQQ